MNASRGTNSNIPDSKLKLPMSGRDHIQGPVDAPINLLEYGDYQCPYCGEVHPVIKAVQERLGKRLCFAFRNFPLTNSHPFAEHAAEAAEAAGLQGKLWEMHDLLFENQDGLDDEALAGYPSALGVDATQLIKEIQTGLHGDRVREDFRSGARAGVNGTPTFFINGVRYDGAYEVDQMLAALTETLLRRGKLK
jgi:protein-disulfide isomerase